MSIRSDKFAGTEFSATLGGTRVRTTRFVSIGSSTSGTVTLPTNSTVVLDDFGGTVDAVVCEISGGKPLQSHALTSTGSIVATTFDASGNWVFSAAPSAYPVALVYRVYQTLINFTSTDSDIWGDAEVNTAAVSQFGITIDGGGSAITTGVKGYIQIPYDCTINANTIVADVAGAIVIDVWKDTYANFPPVVGDSITASAPPTIAATNQSSTDSTLTGWGVGKTCLAGDVLGFNVVSCTTITRATLTLKVTK